jgi:hypothetical protein
MLVLLFGGLGLIVRALKAVPPNQESSPTNNPPV